MAESPTKAEKLAHNAVLVLASRAAMFGALAIGGWGIKVLVDLQTAVGRIPDQLSVIETKVSGRVDALEKRVDAQRSRLDAHDQRFDRLERPYFEPRKIP